MIEVIEVLVQVWSIEILVCHTRSHRYIQMDMLSAYENLPEEDA